MTIGHASMYVTPTRMDFWSGNAASGPFSSRASFTSSEATSNAFGRMIVGGGQSGRSITTSFIGSARGDIAISTRANGSPRVYIVDGDKITMPFSGTVESLADVIVPLTTSFSDFSRRVTAISDMNGDGYGDLVVAETDYSASPITGHVLILW